MEDEIEKVLSDLKCDHCFYNLEELGIILDCYYMCEKTKVCSLKISPNFFSSLSMQAESFACMDIKIFKLVHLFA